MLKKLGLTLLTLFLILAALLLIGLRYPTPFQIEPSTFAPRYEFSDAMPELKIQHFLTGSFSGWEAFLRTGGSLFKQRIMPTGAILVEHPKGKLLIDAGLGKNFPQEWLKASWLLRLLPLQFIMGLSDYLGQYPELKDLDGILITHAHWDHLSGINDLPGVPVYFLPEEIAWLDEMDRPYTNNVFPEHQAAVKLRSRPIELKEVPYENFSQSLDWFGDGSVVLVSLSGHTPGSLGVFLNLSSDRRFLVVGDALWGVSDEGKPHSRSWLAEQFSDHDRTEARRTREKLRELVEHSNEIQLVPVHDARALEKLTSPMNP